ncbi:MAG TPA: hypothetical protein PLA02_10145 [Brevefilum fermentans]|jgi:hypothetical protein|nr:hypothetical protein [Brevefilum fermentans]
MFRDEQIIKWLNEAMDNSGGFPGMRMLYSAACSLISLAMTAYNQMVYTRFSVTGRWEE